MLTKTPVTILTPVGLGFVYESRYQMGGGIALSVRSKTDEPIAVLTVNVPELHATTLGAGEVLIKTWSGQDWVPAALAASPCFEDRHATLSLGGPGDVKAQVWRYRPEVLQ